MIDKTIEGVFFMAMGGISISETFISKGFIVEIFKNYFKLGGKFTQSYFSNELILITTSKLFQRLVH
jgi:hypothetical protein